MAVDEQTVQRVRDFHGHMCPGLAMGIRAAEVALAEIGPHSADEEIVAITETDMCGVDAIQLLTGCTFGKGNLVHHDHGKIAFTFIRRSDGRAIRVSLRPADRGPTDAERRALRAKLSDGTATARERERLDELQRERCTRILTQPVEELYEIREVQAELPRLARVLASVQCDACGEPTMETRLRRLEGALLCPPCFDRRWSRD